MIYPAIQYLLVRPLYLPAHRYSNDRICMVELEVLYEKSSKIDYTFQYGSYCYYNNIYVKNHIISMLNFSKSDSSASEDKLLEEEIAQSGKSELPFYFFYLGIILGAAALSFITSGSPNAFSYYLPILIFLILILIGIAKVFTGSYRYSKNFQNRLNKFFSAFFFIL